MGESIPIHWTDRHWHWNWVIRCTINYTHDDIPGLLLCSSIHEPDKQPSNVTPAIKTEGDLWSLRERAEPRGHSETIYVVVLKSYYKEKKKYWNQIRNCHQEFTTFPMFFCKEDSRTSKKASSSVTSDNKVNGDCDWFLFLHSWKIRLIFKTVLSISLMSRKKEERHWPSQEVSTNWRALKSESPRLCLQFVSFLFEKYSNQVCWS